MKNPLVYIGVTIFFLFPVFFSWDPYTPLLFGSLALGHFFISKGAYKKFFSTLRLLLLLPLGLVILNLLFSQPEPGSRTVELLFLSVPSSSVYRAMVVGLRGIALIVISVAALYLIEPVRFIESLMQNLKISPRVGYSFFVAWNIVPRLKNDLQEIQAAHRIRMRGSGGGIKDLPGGAVALLAGAMRHAERASISLYARGIEDAKNRTFIRKVSWRKRDTIHLLLWGVLSLGECSI